MALPVLMATSFSSADSVGHLLNHVFRVSSPPNALLGLEELNVCVQGSRGLVEDYLREAKAAVLLAQESRQAGRGAEGLASKKAGWGGPKGPALIRSVILETDHGFYFFQSEPADPSCGPGTPEFDLSKVGPWVGASMRWSKKAFGEGLLCSVLHLDELAPHLHLLIREDRFGLERPPLLPVSLAESVTPGGQGRFTVAEYRQSYVAFMASKGYDGYPSWRHESELRKLTPYTRRSQYYRMLGEAEDMIARSPRLFPDPFEGEGPPLPFPKEEMERLARENPAALRKAMDRDLDELLEPINRSLQKKYDELDEAEEKLETLSIIEKVIAKPGQHRPKSAPDLMREILGGEGEEKSDNQEIQDNKTDKDQEEAEEKKRPRKAKTGAAKTGAAKKPGRKAKASAAKKPGRKAAKAVKPAKKTKEGPDKKKGKRAASGAEPASESGKAPESASESGKAEESASDSGQGPETASESGKAPEPASESGKALEPAFGKRRPFAPEKWAYRLIGGLKVEGEGEYWRIGDTRGFGALELLNCLFG
ncbi:MAG: hypothetical protein LBE49_09245, partial [Deltaproteobacteria bacterium]|nr:hypothetical protein [Deltaproteobacteria bacterium]